MDNHRPIIWSGFESGEHGVLENGHAWVCDGYNEENLFHMNWGWGGNDNGYYSIDILNPPGFLFESNKTFS